MISAHCRAPLSLTTLIEYWLGELEAAPEAAVDEHLLGCAHCSEHLQSLVEVGDGIRALVQQGRVRAAVTNEFAQRLAAQGLRLREYRVPQNGSVHCTVAPDDDVVLTRLQVPLAGVQQVDVIALDDDLLPQARMRDVPFDAHAGEVIYTPSIEQLRTLPAGRTRVRLLAVDQQGERVLGDYTFLHAPWQEGA